MHLLPAIRVPRCSERALIRAEGSRGKLSEHEEIAGLDREERDRACLQSLQLHGRVFVGYFSRLLLLCVSAGHPDHQGYGQGQLRQRTLFLRPASRRSDQPELHRQG